MLLEGSNKMGYMYMYLEYSTRLGGTAGRGLFWNGQRCVSSLSKGGGAPVRESGLGGRVISWRDGRLRRVAVSTIAVDFGTALLKSPVLSVPL